MDLTTNFGDTKLKVRVAGIISGPKGYLFEKSEKDYIFLLGGKVMANETSEAAMIREAKEEIGMQISNLRLVSVMENLYGSGNDKVHEICFVYNVGTTYNAELPAGFIEVPQESLNQFKILPEPIAEILRSDDQEQFRHILIK
jgi:8-oxo-dGTP pyrophosphatase MutT (NUDIX family)